MKRCLLFIICLGFAFISNAENITVDTEDEKVYTVVQKKPEFVGGDVAMMKFLSENIRFPNTCATGRVVCKFVITSKGDVTNVVVIRSVAPELDKEAVRVIESMPKWIPGEHAGEPVNVEFILPISFKIAVPDNEENVPE